MDYQKNLREKKIIQTKLKIHTNTYFSSILSFENNYKNDKNKKYKNNHFFNVLWFVFNKYICILIIINFSTWKSIYLNIYKSKIII